MITHLKKTPESSQSSPSSSQTLPFDLLAPVLGQARVVPVDCGDGRDFAIEEVLSNHDGIHRCWIFEREEGETP